MIFFVLFAVFLALASASPPMTGAPGDIVNAAHAINDCDYGTYEVKIHAGSPWAADCMKLADNIFGDGTWYILGTMASSASLLSTRAAHLAPGMRNAGRTLRLPACRYVLPSYQWCKVLLD